MSSEEVLPCDENPENREDMNAAEVLLSLKMSDTSKDHHEQPSEKGDSLSPDSRDSSKEKRLALADKNNGNIPSKRTSVEKSNISHDMITKYEFYIQDFRVIKGEKETLYLCDICDKSYLYSFSLKRHYLNTHINSVYLPGNEIFNCKISEITVKKHYERYKAAMTLNQDQQNQRAGILSYGNNCAKDGGNPLLYCCNICMEMFDEKEPLKYHLGIHKTNDNCKNRFKQRNTKSNFCCLYCSKNFQDADSKKQHEEESHGHCCDHCSSVFVLIEDLKEHISVEHSEFSHQYFCSQENYLTERPRECLKRSKLTVICPAKSTNEVVAEDEKESLSIGDKNSHLKYGCTVCRKGFNSYDNMRRHRRLAHNSFAGKNKSRSSASRNSLQTTDNIFFENLSSHIAYNLANNIDGKNINQVTTDSSTKMETESSKHNIQWSLYNFPPNFDLENSIEQIGHKEYFWVEDYVKYMNTSNLSNQVKSGDNSSIMEPPVLKEFCNNSYNDNQFLLNNDNQQANQKSIFPDLDISDKDAMDSADFVFSKKNQQLQKKKFSIYVCSVCCSAFGSKEKVEEHKLNNHINVLCTYMEFEDEAILPSLYFPSCSPFGAIHHSQCPPSTVPDMQLLCTKCKSAFFSTSDLHSHILQCASKTVNINECNEVANLSSSVNKQKLCTRTVKNKTSMGRPIKLINLTNGKFTYSSLKNRLWKKFKNKPKENRKSKQNCIDVPDSNITQVVRSNYEKIVSNSAALQQEKDSHSNGVDLSTEKNETHNLPLKSKKVVADVKNKLFQRNFDLKENMQPSIPWCSHCGHAFSYMANYRKHVIDGCPIKKQKEEYQDKIPLDFTKQDETVKTLPVQRQVKQNIDKEFNTQSSRSELQLTSLSGTLEIGMFQCPICHKTFQNVVNQMTCVMSHKLHSGESSTLGESSIIEDGNSCNDPDFSEVKNDVTELSLIGENAAEVFAVKNSLEDEVISDVDRDAIIPCTQIKKKCDSSRELNTQNESHNLGNRIKETKRKTLSGERCHSQTTHKRRLCNTQTNRPKQIGKAKHKELNTSVPEQLNASSPEQRTKHICQTQKKSDVATQNSKPIPYGLRRKRKIIESLLTMPFKRTRKTHTTDKTNRKMQTVFVSRNAKKTPKRKAQEKTSVKDRLRNSSKL